MNKKCQKRKNKMCILCHRKDYSNLPEILKITCTKIVEIPSMPTVVNLVLTDCYSLVKINKSPKLKKLLLNQCTTIKTIEKMNSLEILEIYTCPPIDLSIFSRLRKLRLINTFQKIPVFSTLKTLLIKGCNNIEIPVINSLRSLSWNYNEFLYFFNIKIPFCKNLKYLKCSKVENLPIFPKLKKLYIDMCFIKEIPRMSGLKSLYITYCNNLKKIPRITSLETLSISYCHELEKIEYSPNLINLHIYSRTSITEIPHFPKLEEAGISDDITEIPAFQHLKSLTLHKCVNLKEIPILPSLTYLSCKFCLVKKIPALFSLETLELQSCPLLTEICRYPQKISIYDCPWVENIYIPSKKFTKKIETLKKLQIFCRKYVKYSIIKNYMKTEEFCKWFYDPKNFGGYKSKQRLLKCVS